MKKKYVKPTAEAFQMPVVLNLLATSLSLYQEDEIIGYEDLEDI